MAAYGGYSKTSYGGGGGGGDDGGGGGGFFGGGGGGGSQGQHGSQGYGGGGGGGSSKSYANESLRPVTVKQLIECEEPYPNADLAIDNIPITQVTIVGQVRAVNPQTTNVTYRIDDGTGTMDVKRWVDVSDEQQQQQQQQQQAGQFALDSYVRVWGRLKSFNGKKHVGAHFMRPVDDFNEVNYHLLEAAYTHLYLTRGGHGHGQNAGGGDGDGMFVDGGGHHHGGNHNNMGGTDYDAGGGGGGGGGAGVSSDVSARLAGCSPKGRKMFNFLLRSPGGNEGLHVNQIAKDADMTVRDVLGAADELLGQGLIYTTIDDETWAILDY